MSSDNHKIALPAAVIKQLRLHVGDQLQITVPADDSQQVTLKAQHATREQQTLPTRWFLIPSILASLIFFGYFASRNQTQIALTGNDSIASAVITLGLITGSLSFIFFYFIQKRDIQRWLTGSLYWRSFPTILLSFIVILTVAVLGFFWFMGILFKSVTFDQFTSTFLFFLFVSLINYLMILSVTALSANMIFLLLISVIVGGALSAMITNSNKRWWEHNISFLGTQKASYSWQFNLTLIVSALLTLALVDFIFVNLQKRFGTTRRLITLRILLTLTALSLAGVGVFANNGRGWLHLIHDQMASLMVYCIIAIIIGIRYFLPRLTPEFITLSYVIGGLLVTASLLFQPIGYLSLTAYELIGFTMAFAWLLLLLQRLQRLVVGEQATYTVTIE
ncbi:DUF998 domain-containing protein [Furfurilactobacillus curtus]|uniref:Transcriptional regulator n=1 Tax=Furfurilactobacillus curtus TaxID=1746200 RepID=A0ABQ5JT98_9LACO